MVLFVNVGLYSLMVCRVTGSGHEHHGCRSLVIWLGENGYYPGGGCAEHVAR